LYYHFLCNKYNIHFTYLGTGCIFKYDDEHPFGLEENGFTEESMPNFFGSSYSTLKGFTDRLMKFFKDSVLNLRIRMPIQAVIGINALDELEQWVIHRRQIANIYIENLKNVNGVRLTIPSDIIFHLYYKFYFFIEPKKFKISRDEIIELINVEGIFCQIGSCGEVYKENALKRFTPNNHLNVSQELFNTAILLLCDPTISEEIALSNIIKNILIKIY